MSTAVLLQAGGYKKTRHSLMCLSCVIFVAGYFVLLNEISDFLTGDDANKLYSQKALCDVCKNVAFVTGSVPEVVK